MSEKQKLAVKILSKVRSMNLDVFARKVTRGDKGAGVMVLRGLRNNGAAKLARKVKTAA